MNDILIAAAWFLGIGGILGLLLAIAAKLFFVKEDERIGKIVSCLPGANCGGCGYPGCAGYAKAVVENGEKTNKCVAGGDEASGKISEIMGVKSEQSERYRAQVMCSGTDGIASKKYILDGVSDCFAATRLSGGDKMCPNGCVGLGTCAKVCNFNAISVVDGVAVVDYEKCKACGACVDACPKGIIKLIPFDSKYWVGCMSVDKGAKTHSYCKVGCISCRLCEKNCPTDAIHVENFVAHIDYNKCIGCGECEKNCPRHIIKSAYTQKKEQTENAEEKEETAD